ncbi:hypothetical protein FRX31_013311 [Thalictrum thalictroides]|uniref:Uncharacterized protein n=1 Tax=Thalictrum thalictroides TaxID=46969 RepID=A0A7J6WKF3_THATH|nr:hypothetical protein FRX31_013311 [Thalictrum thalictroides]
MVGVGKKISKKIRGSGSNRSGRGRDETGSRGYVAVRMGLKFRAETIQQNDQKTEGQRDPD